MEKFVITSLFALVTVFTDDRVILAAYSMVLRLRLVHKPFVYDVTSCVCISVDFNATYRWFQFWSFWTYELSHWMQDEQKFACFAMQPVCIQ